MAKRPDIDARDTPTPSTPPGMRMPMWLSLSRVDAGYSPGASDMGIDEPEGSASTGSPSDSNTSSVPPMTMRAPSTSLQGPSIRAPLTRTP